MLRSGWSVVLLASAFVALGSGRSDAGLITYFIEGRATGTLGDVAFADADFSLAATADEADIYEPFPFPGVDILAVPALTTTITVEGIGTAELLAEVIIFVNRITSVFGPFSQGLGDLLDVQAPAFATYDLSAPFGPIPGAEYLTSNDPLIPTTLGLLQFDPAARPTGLSVRAEAVPGPSSLALCGIAGLPGLGYATSRRRRLAKA